MDLNATLNERVAYYVTITHLLLKTSMDVFSPTDEASMKRTSIVPLLVTVQPCSYMNLIVE